METYSRTLGISNVLDLFDSASALQTQHLLYYWIDTAGSSPGRSMTNSVAEVRNKSFQDFDPRSV